MNTLHIKNDEKALMGFEPAHNGKRMDELMVAIVPTELFMLTINKFQNHT